MKLILVRHGQDDTGCRGGWYAGGLTPEGTAQAGRLAARLKTHCGDYGISAIITSDLPRAEATAALIADDLGIEVQKEPRLREINNGDLAGMPNETALLEYPGLFFNTLQMDEAYPNGESPREFFERVKDWFGAFTATHRDKTGAVLAVTHGGVINILHHLVTGIPWSNRSPAFKAEPCCMHLVDLSEMTYTNETDCD